MTRSILLGFMAFFFALPGGLNAQDSAFPSKDDAVNLVKLNFDGLFTGRYQFAYERLLGRYTSVQFSAGLLYDLEVSESVGSNLNVNRELTGVVLTPEFRVYLSEFTSDNPPKGFFVGAFGRYRNFSELDQSEDDFQNYRLERDVQTVGMGLHIGFQYYTSFGVGFDAWVGPEFRFRNEFEKTEIERFDPNPEVFNGEVRTRIQETVVFAGIGVVYAF